MSDAHVAGLSEEEFENRKRQIAIELFEQTKVFMQTDDLLNRTVIGLIQAVTDNIKANPKLFESESSASIDDLVRQMKTATGVGGDKSGADIFGGGVLSSIADFIHSIGDFIKGEKDFILQIIRLIFCGCK